ncbi:hypothetical protein T10_639 [Trichinella papuae]|uniref:Uncharacterized protein n=1 Tax=Trichinella papuae TaxID=268474 RepID=A0A0V1MH03_9BILA|nr:hypothetical protein T10_639 [Trichinella papuae]
MKRCLVNDVLHCPWEQVTTAINPKSKNDCVPCGQFLSANAGKDHPHSDDAVQQRLTSVPNRPHLC